MREDEKVGEGHQERECTQSSMGLTEQIDHKAEKVADKCECTH